ncbi:MAG: hypothetical protein IT301_00495 [Dehalococcoidia bacterium]|nr:hypothetical protein [Dehalococcoidia bacterium]
MGRSVGHGLGALFIVAGVIMVGLGLNDAVTGRFDTANCSGSGCASDTLRATLLITGVAFIASGLLSSLLTEFIIRKTRKLMASVTTVSSNPGDLTGISEMLRDFGIQTDLSKAHVTTGRPVTLDLRSMRTGEVPTDPAGLSAYLKERGVTIDEEALRRATIFQGGTLVHSAEPVVTSAGTSEPAPAGVGPRSADDSGQRETATIIRKTDRGPTPGRQRLLEFELEVRPASKPPYRVSVASLVRESLADLLIEGSTLNVRVNPHDANDVTIDWGEN